MSSTLTTILVIIIGFTSELLDPYVFLQYFLRVAWSFAIQIKYIIRVSPI